MTLKQVVTDKLTESFEPTHLEVVNESSMHNVPPGSESHFRLLVVARHFDGKSRLQRHRAINDVLAQELRDSLHALAVEALTPQEWEARAGRRGSSPPCRGGSQA